jgi:hypothetical protein
LPDLVRQSIYSRLAGYEDLNDAARLSTDPTFRLIGSLKRWDRSAALTSTLHWFETELMTREENLVGLMAVNRDVIGQAVGPVRIPPRMDLASKTRLAARIVTAWLV